VQVVVRVRSREPEIACEQQGVLDLAGRAHRVVQEASEVVVGEPAAPLRDVGQDRHAGTPELARQAKTLL
jgi:hypothetical protein